MMHPSSLRSKKGGTPGKIRGSRRGLGRALGSAVTISGLLMMSAASHGGVRIDGPGESWLGISSRLQTVYDDVDSDLVKGRGRSDFDLRRARIQMGFHMNKWAMAFMQTEVGSSAVDDGNGGGSDLRLMSAWFLLKPDQRLQFMVGQHISGGGGRNAFESSGTYLAGDLYNVALKGMNIGTRAGGGIFSTIIPNTDAGLRITEVPRDRGVTLFGHQSASEDLHFKWYGTVNDGAVSAQQDGSDSFRYMFRGEVNIGDAENNIFPKGTWLGAKQTLALGFSIETQEDVAFDTSNGKSVDYNFWTVDAFTERKLGPGVVTLTGAWMDLDLDDAKGRLSSDRAGNNLLPGNATGEQAQGSGGYVSLGYLFSKKFGPGRLQPSVTFETWDSDDDNDVGSFDSYRVGVNYYLQGQDLVLKAFYARDDLDWTAGNNGATDDAIDSVMLGIYTDF